jgi:sterol desaturase/sphingolipid hydroxylase (fatty acid hydroxylase superfamily)
MNFISKLVPGFLQKERLSNFSHEVMNEYGFLSFFLVFNTPLAYTIYNSTFDIRKFLTAYVVCGIGQGFINTGLYFVSDLLFFGKKVDTDALKKTVFYEYISLNLDTIYLYLLGATTYTALTVVPQSIRWTMDFPGYKQMVFQIVCVAILNDVFFSLIHYVIHKIPYLRISHMKLHHDCPFDIANSRCAVSATGVEALVRDLYSAILPTYIVGYFGMPFYVYSWLLYYSIYSFWAMYVHSGVNVYHRIHHSKTPNLNYGLYYITDYFMGTLVLEEKKNE